MADGDGSGGGARRLPTREPAAIRRAIGAYDVEGPGDDQLDHGEAERYGSILPLVLEHRTKVIALAMDDSGPGGRRERFAVATKLVKEILAACPGGRRLC